jgi:hypothetical protein
MTNSLCCAQADDLPELSEARSLFWAITQLTAESAADKPCGRSYLFELHQLAIKGLALTERLLDRCESWSCAND